MSDHVVKNIFMIYLARRAEGRIQEEFSPQRRRDAERFLEFQRNSRGEQSHHSSVWCNDAEDSNRSLRLGVSAVKSLLELHHCLKDLIATGFSKVMMTMNQWFVWANEPDPRKNK